MTEESRELTVAAVLLAAGESTRMREGDDELASKALLPWGDSTLVEYQVRALHEAGYEPIVVVLGHEAERVAAALPDDVPVSALFNQRYQIGRTTSIVTGVLPLATPDIDAVLIISVDQPRSVAMLRTLRETWESEQPYILVPTLDVKPGHPPLFDGGLIPEVLQVSEQTEGLREVMRNFHDKRLLVAVDDPLTLTNLNTQADYEAALKLA